MSQLSVSEVTAEKIYELFRTKKKWVKYHLFITTNV